MNQGSEEIDGDVREAAQARPFSMKSSFFPLKCLFGRRKLVKMTLDVKTLAEMRRRGRRARG